MGHSSHSPFTSLAPLSWRADIAGRDPSALAELLSTTLANAQLLIDSTPTPTPPTACSDLLRPSTPTGDSSTGGGGGRARSHTAPSSPSFSRDAAGQSSSATQDGAGGVKEGGWKRTPEEEETVRKLRGEWKDLKMLPQDKGGKAKGKGDSGGGSASNPHGIAMYKMGAKDGKGAWFARRSLHRPGGVGGFEKWEAALRREMQETLARVKAEPGKEPGTGNIRGIGAERRVEGVEFDEGKMDLYHVSARFPGPTTPRDFVALIMMPREEQKRRQPRQFMIVSRPCEHPDCPPRSGFIRGTYESVELIREVPLEKPIRRVRSSIDFSKEERDGITSGVGEHMSRDAMLRAAKRATGDEVESEGEAGTAPDDDAEMAIEWLMVTRSDPGGSVPRFMVEKGTPGGIMNDAGKFLKWLSSQTIEDLTKPLEPQEDGIDTKPTGELPTEDRPGQAPADASVQDQLPDDEADQYEETAPPSSSGIYGMLTSALGAATSAVSSRVAAFAPVTLATDSDFSDDDSDISDASYESAEEGSATHSDTALPNGANKTNSEHPSTNTLDATSATDGTSIRSTHSGALSETTSQALSREPTPSSGGGGGSTGVSQAQAQHEKELRKLQQRMRKAQDKLERAQARRRAKHGGGDATADETGGEDAALAKLREKHEREVARQEEKYRKEMQRLADKRAAEERKAEERRRKAAEKEERAGLAMELERARAERDVARKEVEMLRERVGELQAQNTRLVARLGREGVDLSAEELKKEGK